jgi:hypothetical protein
MTLSRGLCNDTYQYSYTGINSETELQSFSLISPNLFITFSKLK